MVSLIPTVLYGSAVALNGIFHVDAALGISYFAAIWLLVILVGLIGCCYTVLGGFKAITISDLVQGAGLVVGGILLLGFGLRYLGQGSVVQEYKPFLLPKKNTSMPLAGRMMPFHSAPCLQACS